MIDSHHHLWNYSAEEYDWIPPGTPLARNQLVPELEQAAAAAGVDVDLFVAPDMPHAFFAFDCEITRKWFEHQASWIEARL